MSTDVEVSVSICTYNRVRSLERALGSLELCSESCKASWELVLIDNNSQDETREMARIYEGRLPIRYLLEPKQGLSQARNRAIREFRGDLLIFTDDDVEFDDGWLSAYSNAAQNHPAAKYFGGKIIPRYEEGRPKWLFDERLSLISGLIGSYDLGETTRPYSARDMHPFGANFALRRDLIERVGSFRTDLGVAGELPGRGEEAEYFQRVQLGHHSGVYLNDAVCYHYNASERFSLRNLYAYGKEKGKAEYRITGVAPNQGSAFRPMVTFVKGLYQLVTGRPDRFRQNIINLGIARGLHFADQQSGRNGQQADNTP